MTDRVGQQLGNYRLMRLLGCGGFAEVYLGQHLRLNMQAAVKVLHTQLADSNDIQNFHREAQTIASLIHPHIVRILDFDVKDGVPFLVMDYAPNGSLRRQHPKGVPLPLPTIVSYVKQVADALQYAHERKLIHRDVKPENMLLGRHNEVLLSDFGTAIIAQSSRYQGAQDMVGTIAYMAPEQIQAYPRPASDQYALGVVVYEWLCGEYPFQGSFSEIAAKHTMMPPPSLRRKMPTISPEMEQVVMTALAKDPRQRFASVQGFAAALEQASVGARMIVPASTPMSQLLQASAKTSLVIKGPQPVATDPSMTPPGRMAQAPVTMTPPGQSRKQISTPNVLSEAGLHHQGVSRRTVILGLGVTGLAVAGGGIAWLVSSQQFPPSSSLGPTPTPIPLGTPLYTYRGHSDLVIAVAWSPHGRRMASGGKDLTVQVWDAADGGHAYTYHGHSNTVSAVAWSPDGKHIASGSYDQTVQVWDATDGGHAYTYHGHSNTVFAVAWSPDGQRIASGSGPINEGSDTTVQVWNAADGSNVYTYRGHSSDVSAVAWSPDSKLIASGSDDNTVQVWDATDGGHVYTYRGHSDAVSAVAWSPDGRRIASGSFDQTVQV